MGMRRRARRRGLIVGAAVGATAAHHRNRNEAEEQQAYDQTDYAPPPADPTDQLEHLAQLHASGALTDEEFAAAKAKVIGA